MGDSTEANNPERTLVSAEVKTFTIGVREIHVRFYSVQAENTEQAMELVHQRADGVVDLEYEEYSHELDQSTWSVEEKKP